VQLGGIVARAGDRLRLIENDRTWAVVTLFGYGIGVYDLNAIEANDSGIATATQPREIVALSTGALPASDPCNQATMGEWPCPVRDVVFSPEATLGVGVNGLKVYALEPRSGVLDLSLVAAPPGSDQALAGSLKRGPTGLVVSNSYVSSQGQQWWYHARLKEVGTRFRSLSGRDPVTRLTGSSPFGWRREAHDNGRGERGSTPNVAVTRDYLLVAASELGLLVVQTGEGASPTTLIRPQLDQPDLVDVIWIPTGAMSVRTLPGSNYATVTDQAGRVLLVDLTNIDQRFGPDGTPRPEGEIFPSLEALLRVGAPAGEVGYWDPRVVFRSEPGVAAGTLAPLGDAITGLLYTGRLLDRKLTISAVLDPPLRIMADLGAGRLSEVGGVVPLGVDPPDNVLLCNPGVPLEGTSPCNASLAAFRLELTLPGSLGNQTGGAIPFALESERVSGAVTEQTPDPLPRAHLRTLRPDGSHDPRGTSFALRPIIPPQLAAANRHQKGFNRYVSPWVVALADPRASERYDWGGADPRAAGCNSCERPLHLRGRTESEGIYEITSSGRLFSVRPETGSPTSGWLASENRFTTSFPTVMADTVRPTEVLVAAQEPPIFPGAIQTTVYAHSGEAEISETDLVAPGRAGWDVRIDRVYRSRTIGETAFGPGWTSNVFRRLRELANGDVEYRDEDGEWWLFKTQRGPYFNVRGKFVRLSRHAGGWKLIDTLGQVSTFDALGRLIEETDRFYVDLVKGSGNRTRYQYDTSGRLAAITDAVGRSTRLYYYELPSHAEGLVREVVDWRGRRVSYEYDDARRLTHVRLPEFAPVGGVPAQYTHTGARRPAVKYTYAGAGAGFRERLELHTNLESITDPQEQLDGGVPRVTLRYGAGSDYDRIVDETWPCGSSGSVCQPVTARFEWGIAPTLTDIYGQRQAVRIEDGPDGRKHLSLVKRFAVPATSFTSGQYPDAAPPDLAPELRDLQTTFLDRTQDGQAQEIELPDGGRIRNTFEVRLTPAAHRRLTSSVELTADGQTRTTVVNWNAGAPQSSSSQSSTPQDSSSQSIPFSISRGLHVRDLLLPHRGRTVLTALDDDRKVITKYSPTGLLGETASSDSPTEGWRQTVEHFSEDDASAIRRSAPRKLVRGTSRTMSTETLTVDSAGGYEEVTRDEDSGLRTSRRFDSWDRLTEERLVGTNGEVLSHVKFGYDASGRLAYRARTQREVGLVEETFDYDPLGRLRSTSLSKANVAGAESVIRTSSEYDLAARTVTETAPFVGDSSAAARSVTKLDALGRAIEIVQQAPGESTSVVKKFAYDVNGQLSYVTDGVRGAAIYVADGFGRVTNSVASDGTSTSTTYTDWDEPQTSIQFDRTGSAIAQTNRIYTSKGRLRAVNERIDPPLPGTSVDRVRQTRFDWMMDDMRESQRVGIVDDMTTITFAAATPVRYSVTDFDAARRPIRTESGAANGAVDSPTQTVERLEFHAYRGDQPTVIEVKEPLAGSDVGYTLSRSFDELGRLVLSADGNLAETRVAYDESGNVLTVTSPGMAAAAASFDSRGLQLTATHPDGSKIHNSYDASGQLREYRDESGVITSYIRDPFGRVRRVTYADGTYEESRYEDRTGALSAARDRAGNWTSFVYDRGGRVTEVRAGEIPASGAILRSYRYDDAGRLTRVANADAAVEFDAFDFLGRPRTNRSIRYAGSSGLTEQPSVRDAYTQNRRWNEFGETSRWSLPAAGTVGAQSEFGGGWRTWIDQTWDAAGNLTMQRSAAGLVGPASGEVISQAFSRGPGRIHGRTRLPSGAGIGTVYSYGDGRLEPVEIPDFPGGPDLVGGDVSGRLRRVETSTQGGVVAGGFNRFDASQRLAGVYSLALGGRASSWGYDARGRLRSTSLLGQIGSATGGAIENHLSAADVLLTSTAPPVLGSGDIERLGGDAWSVARPSWQTSDGPAHQIGDVSLRLGGLPERSVAVAWDGGRRTRQGSWEFSYDEFGRLRSMTAAAEGRKIDYLYDPLGRVVGRTAWQKGSDEAWLPETRADVLERDGLPADVTLVWDPMDDRLVALYRSGVQTASSGPAAGLLRQYVHGDRGYDDPVEILVGSGGTAAVRYYPIVDEAGAGSVEAVADASGNLVERILYGDAYGAEPRYVTGPVVDDITCRAAKAADGTLSAVQIRLHASEAVSEASLAAGVHLVASGGAAGVGRPAPGAPHLADGDPHTIVWHLTGGEWRAFVSGAERVAAGVTSALRSPIWGEAPPQPAPEWARILHGVESSATHPVSRPASLAELTQFFESIAPGTSAETILYTIPDLYLAAAEASRTRLLTGFQALPFSEPATGLVYARARWYDPATGSFLTPDPLGYRDSSNLYSFAGGDPVNRRDPTGTIVQFEGSQPEQRLGYKDVIGWVDNAEAKQYLKFNGATRRIDVVGITEDEFISRFEGTAAGLLGKMIKAPKVLRIWAVTADTPKKATFDSLNGTENVRWRLKKAGGGWFTGTSDGYIVLYDRDRLPAPTMMSDNRTPNVAQTPETLIAHEVGGHAYDKMIGITFDTGVITVGSDPFFGVPPGEAAGLYSENLYRKAHGLPPRKKYKVLAGDWDPPEDIKQWFRDLAAGNERPTPGYPNVFEKP
jgi:RHS repeat-associated protein